LRELYKSAIEEYRFQVQLNWSRTQYLLAFNAAILAVGTGLLKLDSRAGDLFTAAVFAVGVFTSVSSLFVTAAQHEYYRMARNRVRRIGAELGHGEFALDTTTGMTGGRRPWFGRVTNIIYVLFGILGALNLSGATYSSYQSVSKEPSPPAQTTPSSPAPGTGIPQPGPGTSPGRTASVTVTVR
jgi:hypothetical protein